MSDGCHWKRAQALRRIQQAREALSNEGLNVARGIPQGADWPGRVDALLAEYAAASKALEYLSDCSED